MPDGKFGCCWGNHERIKLIAVTKVRYVEYLTDKSLPARTNEPTSALSNRPRKHAPSHEHTRARSRTHTHTHTHTPFTLCRSDWHRLTTPLQQVKGSFSASTVPSGFVTALWHYFLPWTLKKRTIFLKTRFAQHVEDIKRRGKKIKSIILF